MLSLTMSEKLFFQAALEIEAEEMAKAFGK